MQDNREIFDSFFETITGSRTFGDFHVEVVFDYKSSRYFKSDELFNIYDISQEAVKAGQECHFGPAVRNENLGSARSNGNNLLYAKSLWVDIDSPDKGLPAEERLKKAGQLLDEFLEALKSYNLEPSYIICSGHGYHTYFVLQKIYPFPSSYWQDMEAALIHLAKGDLQAKDATHLLRVPLTYNHKDPSNPRPVEFLTHPGTVWDEKDFEPIVRAYKAGIGKHDMANQPQGVSKALGFTPPCIEHLLEPETSVELGHRHEARLVIGTFAFHEGWNVEDTIERVKHFTDDPKKSEDDIRGIYESLEKDPEKYHVGCKEGSHLRGLIEAGITVCDKDGCLIGKPHNSKEASEEERSEMSASFDGLVDLVLDDQGKLVFLVKEDGQLVMKDQHNVSGKVFTPPPDDQIIWKLPRGSEVIRHWTQDTDSALFEDLAQYHYTISEMPTPTHYKFLAAWVMHTYLTEQFEYTPIPWLFGIAERGKSRTGKGMIYASYRGAHVITLREAHLIRMAQDLNATLFIDVMDVWKKAEAAGAEDILLCRFEQGAKVARVLYPERGKFKDTVYYNVFGATVVATNEPVNEILASRTVQTVMPESARQFQTDIKPEIGLPFRERLLGFRARWMDRDLPAITKPCDGRLGDMLKPLRQIVNAVCPDEDWFMKFVKETETNRKRLAADSLEAQTMNAMIRARDLMHDRHLLNENVLAFLNENKPERQWITPQKLGKITARLGFEKYTSGQQRGFYWSDELVNRLAQRYGIDTGIPSL